MDPLILAGLILPTLWYSVLITSSVLTSTVGCLYDVATPKNPFISYLCKIFRQNHLEPIVVYYVIPFYLCMIPILSTMFI